MSSHHHTDPLYYLSPRHTGIYELVTTSLQHDLKRRNSSSLPPYDHQQQEQQHVNKIMLIQDEFLTDYGGVQYRYVSALVCKEDNNPCGGVMIINVSVYGWKEVSDYALPVLNDLAKNSGGALQLLFARTDVNDVIRTDEDVLSLREGFDLAIRLDCSVVSEDEVEFYGEILSGLRIMILGAPLQHAFQNLGNKLPSHDTSAATKAQTGSVIKLPLVCPNSTNAHNGSHNTCHVAQFVERVTIVFGVVVLDDTERALAHVFLQSFADKSNSGNDASLLCDFRRPVQGPPSDIDVGDCQIYDNVTKESLVGYLCLTFFENVSKERQDRAVGLVVSFFSYLEYHITASKSYVQRRMREKETLFLKALACATTF